MLLKLFESFGENSNEIYYKFSESIREKIRDLKRARRMRNKKEKREGGEEEIEKEEKPEKQEVVPETKEGMEEALKEAAKTIEEKISKTKSQIEKSKVGENFKKKYMIDPLNNILRSKDQEIDRFSKQSEEEKYQRYSETIQRLKNFSSEEKIAKIPGIIGPWMEIQRADLELEEDVLKNKYSIDSENIREMQRLFALSPSGKIDDALLDKIMEMRGWGKLVMSAEKTEEELEREKEEKEKEEKKEEEIEKEEEETEEISEELPEDIDIKTLDPKDLPPEIREKLKEEQEAAIREQTELAKEFEQLHETKDMLTDRAILDGNINSITQRIEENMFRAREAKDKLTALQEEIPEKLRWKKDEYAKLVTELSSLRQSERYFEIKKSLAESLNVNREDVDINKLYSLYRKFREEFPVIKENHQLREDMEKSLSLIIETLSAEKSPELEAELKEYLRRKYRETINLKETDKGFELADDDKYAEMPYEAKMEINAKIKEYLPIISGEKEAPKLYSTRKMKMVEEELELYIDERKKHTNKEISPAEKAWYRNKLMENA